MDRFSTVLRRAAFSAGLAVGFLLPAHAEAPGLEQTPLQFFSDCLGRVSALRVHRESHGDIEGEMRAEAMRAVLADLVVALTPEDGSGRVLTWRAEARAAQASLLTQASLAADRDAEALAERLIARCASMIVLPGSDPG